MTQEFMSQETRPSRKVSESALITAHLMMPQDANIQGNVYGGTIMKLVDEIAGIVAGRHCRQNVVTASIDRMDFFKPVYIGNLLILKAAVNHVGRTSLEVGVRIEAEDLKTEEVQRGCSKAPHAITKLKISGSEGMKFSIAGKRKGDPKLLIGQLKWELVEIRFHNGLVTLAH